MCIGPVGRSPVSTVNRDASSAMAASSSALRPMLARNDRDWAGLIGVITVWVTGVSFFLGGGSAGRVTLSGIKKGRPAGRPTTRVRISRPRTATTPCTTNMSCAHCSARLLITAGANYQRAPAGQGRSPVSASPDDDRAVRGQQFQGVGKLGASQRRARAGVSARAEDELRD